MAAKISRFWVDLDMKLIYNDIKQKESLEDKLLTRNSFLSFLKSFQVLF